jgi:hypothetical protein
MDSVKYIGMDVHKESISMAVMNSAGKIVMECVIETKASMILQFIDGLRGSLHVTYRHGVSVEFHKQKSVIDMFIWFTEYFVNQTRCVCV